LLGIILFWTGVRFQECIELHVANIDTRRSLVLVREGKGRKARYIPFDYIPFDNDSVRPALLEYLYLRPSWPGPHLWIGQTNDSRRIIKPLLPEGVRQILIRRCRRAHIPYYNPHAWRQANALVGR
jgi:site-specific recombinase XerD